MRITSLRSNKFVIATIIIIALIFLHYTAILSPLEKIIALALSPAQKLIYGGGSQTSLELSKLKKPSNLTAENQALREKVSDLEQQIASLKMFIEENKLVTEQSRYLAARGFKFVKAEVVGRTSDLASNLFILNKGSDDGVKNGLAVAVGQGAVVGKIIKTENRTSFLLLLIDNQCQMSATLAGQSEVVGLAQGEHNISLNLNYILKETNLKQGDLVVTSGLDPHVPAGLLLGEIEKITEEENSLFKSANLISPANFKNLRVVSVVIN